MPKNGQELSIQIFIFNKFPVHSSIMIYRQMIHEVSKYIYRQLDSFKNCQNTSSPGIKNNEG